MVVGNSTNTKAETTAQHWKARRKPSTWLVLQLKKACGMKAKKDTYQNSQCGLKAMAWSIRVLGNGHAGGNGSAEARVYNTPTLPQPSNNCQHRCGMWFIGAVGYGGILGVTK